MDKPKINYIVDVFLGISFFIVSMTGIVIFLFLPSGVRQGSYQEFLGITKGTLSIVHTYAGLIMIALSLAHLILHWKWVVSMTKSWFKKKR